MTWVILTILAVASRSTYSLATRLLSTHVKVSSITQSILLTFFAFLISLVLSPFFGGISFAHLQSVWIPTLIMIISGAAGNILFFNGQSKLDAGTTQIAFSSIVLWGVILSLGFLGSHFSLLQFFGIVLLLFAILLIQYKKGNYKIESAALWICASAACFAIFQVSSASLSKTMSAGTYLPLAYGGSTLIVVVLYYKQFIKDFSILRQNTVNVLQKGFFASGTSLLYFVFSYLAYAAAPDRGVVVLLLTTQTILSVILGIIFLKETAGMKRKLIAGAIAVVASIFIKA
ncbi:MAG TPA: DMT family transporter [Candidatus Eisenbacteria bacterium]|nr:DMT family transporter [Candidatus Eisenbacteria bacterium]